MVVPFSRLVVFEECHRFKFGCQKCNSDNCFWSKRLWCHKPRVDQININLNNQRIYNGQNWFSRWVLQCRKLQVMIHHFLFFICFNCANTANTMDYVVYVNTLRRYWHDDNFFEGLKWLRVSIMQKYINKSVINGSGIFYQYAHTKENIT